MLLIASTQSPMKNEEDEMLHSLLLSNKKFVHSRNKKAFYSTLGVIQRRIRQKNSQVMSTKPNSQFLENAL